MCALSCDFELTRPPQITLPVPIKNAKSVRRAQAALENFFQRQRQQETEFGEAAALLGRLMARRKNSFRGMMGFREVVKCNTAACRLLRIDLPRELENFRNILPDFIPSDTFAVTTLQSPTRNSLDYVLVRLMNVQQVYARIRSCCQQAATYFAKMMRNNFFMDTSALLLAVLAKLHSLSALLGNKCVELYNHLKPVRLRFPISESCTRADFEFPEKMELFPIESAKITEQNSEGTVKSLSLTPTASVTPKLLTPTRPKTAPKILKKLDLGTEVSREPLQQQSTFNIDTELATVADAKRFIAAENAARKQSLKQCITKKIQPHEWVGATRLFERKILADEPRKALSIFKKFISNKVC